MERPLSPSGAFGVFADELLRIELPDLPESARSDTIGFVCRRANQLPSPLKVGVTVLSVGLGFAHRVAGTATTARRLRHSRLPLLGELPRMVRSLAFAYVWETWPSSSPTGSGAGMAA